MKKFVSMFLALAMCLSLAAPAFAADNSDHIHVTEAPKSENFSVYYEMDGKNVVEYISCTGLNVIRTVYPNNTMLVQVIEDNNVITSLIDADYSTFEKLFYYQQSPAPCNNDVTGSQFIHVYVGSPGTQILTKKDIQNYKNASGFAAFILSYFSLPGAAAAEFANRVFGALEDATDYDRLEITSDTYEVLFAMDRTYFTHCYHQYARFYKKDATSPFRTEVDYYQVIGG